MESSNHTDELLNFFKALADANRLKILGLLAQNNYSVEELAELVNLKPSTVSHHLNRLTKTGLVSARAESYYNIYQLETKVLEDLAKRLLSRETLPAVAADVDMGAYDRKVVNNFTLPDGRLKAIPAQQKKLQAILRYIVKDFQINVRYSERQVNQILSRFHEDTATLRRRLVSFKLMDREGGGGEYWRLE